MSGGVIRRFILQSMRKTLSIGISVFWRNSIFFSRGVAVVEDKDAVISWADTAAPIRSRNIVDMCMNN
jgi:hypothetical protein